MEQPETDSEQGLLERMASAMGQEAPAPAEASQEAEVADDEQPAEVAEETSEEEAPQDDGLVELELEDGQTLKVPPQLKDGYLRHSDYTRKTQEVAELQRTAQATLMQNAIAQQFQTQTAEEQQRLAQLQGEIKRLKQLDWTALDFETQFKTRAYLDNLKDEIAETEKTIETKRGQFQRQIQQARSEASKAAYDFISKHVKEWTPDSAMEREVASYAANFGVPRETLAEIAVMFPGFAVMAAKAAQFDRLSSTKGQAVKAAQKAPPVVKPGAVTNTNTVAATKYQKARAEMKKNPGSLDAVARVFLQRGIK